MRRLLVAGGIGGTPGSVRRSCGMMSPGADSGGACDSSVKSGRSSLPELMSAADVLCLGEVPGGLPECRD